MSMSTPQPSSRKLDPAAYPGLIVVSWFGALLLGGLLSSCLTDAEIDEVLDTGAPGLPVELTFRGIEPTEGLMEGGDLVTIDLEPLAPEVGVWFYQTEATVLHSNPSSVTVTAPAAVETGCVDVVVSTGGQAVVLPSVFCYR